jgi:digeranylgeranylglycerophospholipid reductase
MLLGQAWWRRRRAAGARLRMSALEVDVLVAGLGPAGSRAAWAAARAGVRVLAIDRRRRIGEPVQCAELVPALLRQEVDGLAGAVTQTIEAMHTHLETEPPEVTAHFPGAMIERTVFDAALARAACEAGARCRTGVALAAVEADGAARLSDGSTVSARVIIGADGPHSRVGRSVGRLNSPLTHAQQITVPLDRAHGATDIFLSRAMPGGYGWLFPKGDVAHVGAGVAYSERRRLPALVADLHARLVREGRVGTRVLRRTGGAIPAGGPLDPVAYRAGALVLLAGDAAGLANPVTGAGIAAAVQSGTLAGAAAVAWMAGADDALERFREEVETLYGPALARAAARRRALLACYRGDAPVPRAAQRAGWIAYPEYWAA